MVNMSMLLCYYSINFDSECRVSAKALVISDPLIELPRVGGQKKKRDLVYEK